MSSFFRGEAGRTRGLARDPSSSSTLGARGAGSGDGTPTSGAVRGVTIVAVSEGAEDVAGRGVGLAGEAGAGGDGGVGETSASISLVTV